MGTQRLGSFRPDTMDWTGTQGIGLEWRGMDWFFDSTQRIGLDGIGAERNGLERSRWERIGLVLLSGERER
jgi:hypothetical protein